MNCEDLNEEIQCPTCNYSIDRGQLIAENEQYCENCWEPVDLENEKIDEIAVLSGILKKYVDTDTHDKIIQDMSKYPKCECCGVSDKSVGLATGENGVEMWVCRFCDVDGSNYDGWGDVEDECDKCE